MFTDSIQFNYYNITLYGNEKGTQAWDRNNALMRLAVTFYRFRRLILADKNVPFSGSGG
jgi:hypothetical protein